MRDRALVALPSTAARRRRTTLEPPPNGVTARLRAARPVEHRRDVGLVARIGDDIGRVGVIAGEAAHVVGIGLAVGVRGAVVALARAERPRGGGGAMRGARKRDLVERGGGAISSKRSTPKRSR